MAKKYLNLAEILKRLLFDKSMKPVDLAREVNLPPPTIHRLVTGKSTRPYKSSLKPIADFFSISVEELIGEKPLNIKQSSFLSKTQDASSNQIRKLPLIPWNELQNVCLANNNSSQIIPFIGEISEHSFATILEDSSMEPLFTRKSMLIFDPKKQPKDRSYVLIQSHGTDSMVFRQLIIDLDQKYLKPLNPDLNVFKMRPMQANDKIVATLVEARQLYNEF